jgi:methylthioribulose-1-phosphate dehydratase
VNGSRDPRVAPAAAEIVAAGRDLAARGWVPATSGNFSRRVDGNLIAITASGVDKGALSQADVLLYDIGQGSPVGEGRASAETPLHACLYRMRPEIGAVLHTHSRTATLVSKLLRGTDRMLLTDYELLKAFRGIDSHEAEAVLPIFANDQDMPALASRVETRLGAEPAAVGFLISGHGLYTWGLDMGEARRHIEALEFILDCELEWMRLGR